MQELKNLSHKIVIIGGGTAGITVAAQLLRKDQALDIAIIEPAKKHYYQPMWTLAGAGIINKEVTEREEADVMPENVNWIKEFVTKIQASQNYIETNNSKINYDFLIVAPGLRLRPDLIEGLDGRLDHPGIGSIYDYNTVDHFFKELNTFKGGKAIFTMPNTAIKCGGAPQKIMYLAQSLIKDNLGEGKFETIFTSAKQSIFGIDIFSIELNKVIARKNIKTKFGHDLKKVDLKNKKATYNIINGNGDVLNEVTLDYDLLHVTPPMTAHDFILESDLIHEDGPQKGWLDVDIHTLQHKKYKNIFSLGDVAGLPTAKTGAAVRKQAPVVVSNLLSLMADGEIKMPKEYNGYSSCPLVTDEGKVIMAEFGYDNVLLPSFPFNPAKERYSMWLIKRYLLPVLYWEFMLRGQA
ncbi:FAD/NAD(P)-binding oxidoreductase [Bacteriovorax sp. Seq25_V]|uniref:NAD(P)/FAD-dependent oxidoreductase n=1 Tax=Bacteriovorax sp. Seq25_V TaxID=1201288 RepID=UPI00038A13D8|nr:FAD/NAD(P)-binding oxidoreductase [Bacteriovorax sp. Seq25_V]EQC43945.1 pyridine nucleotide-disulfide oxidoreductase [Bacteriovorax sp. Seq25_V]